jgi:hypothetical protein
MSSVYKVTEASVKKTTRGYEVFSLKLNNSILATALVPLKTIDKKYHKLFQFYLANHRTLDSLVGKYIATNLERSQYGHQFGSLESCDVMQDFKKLLDESNEPLAKPRIRV